MRRYRVEPTVTNPAWLGTLPPAELFPFGLWLPWQQGGCDLGRVLFATTLGRLAPELPARLDARVNPEVDDHPGERVRLCDDIGMDLFQEKAGFTWRAQRSLTATAPFHRRAEDLDWQAALLPRVRLVSGWCRARRPLKQGSVAGAGRTPTRPSWRQ